MEEKQKYSNIRDGQFGKEGYGNDEIIAEGQILDWTDRLFLLVQPGDARKLELWPTNPNSLRYVLHEYTMKTKKLVENVLKTAAKSLELNEDFFVSHLGDKFPMFARFNYYPCCLKPDLVFGLKPHSDGPLITVILPEKDVEGLQVLKDGEWIKVTTSPDAFIFNIGDQMEIMSNGIFKSPVHRVVTFSDKDRISIAMFCANLPEKVIGPADELVNDMRPRMYKNLKVKYYFEVFSQMFLQGKRAIDWAHV
ncbi:probable 2-oxoglutarate-dependent dioxygenase ANS [Dioscorea cayenensis subsp. rotundata]|uniref:Probable 2-oxoglutarate-dependent dioxygenase ANS n=1 Tax=Dioscorea cayennensis subsp. rotundata TaxID=55577 RepID=A0AB40AS14_DIOCR|nr:probable 2-oxoglutarate-dependent dioxygenase ANS [Dioscorea cayenensis subsp. rotundata]